MTGGPHSTARSAAARVLLFAACCAGVAGGAALWAYATRGKTSSATEMSRGARRELPIPQVAPYLDAAPSPVDGQGAATLVPAKPVPVRSGGNFEMVFTVGEAGVRPGGFVLLQIPPWWGWTQPQTRRPDGPGYVEVTTSFHDPALQTRTLPFHRVIVYSHERGFRPGETITFRYCNAQADRFAETEELFQIFVDADGDGHAACIKQCPTLAITAGPARKLCVNAPSQVQPRTPIAITAAPVDAVGNWSAFPQGTYTIEIKSIRDGNLTTETSLEVSEHQKTLTFDCVVNEEGAHFFHVQGPSGLEGYSNVCLSQEGTPGLKLYFGDIHGHSRMSDGTGTPEDYYRYARRVSGLDIAALTDHVDYGTLPIKGEYWERIKAAANDANEPGRFVTFLGYEWTSWTYGHRNVYFRDNSGPVFRSIDPESDTPQELWRLLEPFEAMTVAHHVGGGPIHTDWTIPPDPRERLVEVCSIHGASEYFGGRT